jgi:DNA-binding Lrp family transcriptional regulator
MAKDSEEMDEDSEEKDEDEYIPDATDLDILRLLQRDARLSYRLIAKELPIAAGTVHNRVKRLEKEGIIKKYSVVLDLEKLGYQLTALTLARVRGGRLKEVEEQIAQDKRVMAVYDVTGEYDMVVISRFKSRNDLDEFIKGVLTIPDIERTNTSLVLNIRKEQWSPTNL